MSGLSFSVAVRPYPGEQVSGDIALVMQRDGHLLALVADGLGHGVQAHEASMMAAAWVEEQTTLVVSDLMIGLHSLLKGTVGAAIGIVTISQSDRTVQFLGVGNIGARIFGQSSRGLISHPGTVGLVMPSARVQADNLDIGGILFMHSDGISSSFKLEDYPGLLEESPEISTSKIVRRYGKIYDDASCVIVKFEA